MEEIEWHADLGVYQDGLDQEVNHTLGTVLEDIAAIYALVFRVNLPPMVWSP